MIDFSTVTGITVPEGVVTKIECGGVVLWERISDTVILEVEKITSDTFANSTTYTGEQFILLDIYPKTNGTVNVTYGGLTKTITDTSGADEPSAQQVYFGTFKGVYDEVATPASGVLKISGEYSGFGVSVYDKAKSSIAYCDCVISVVSWGSMRIIPDRAFYNCTKLTSIEIPDGIDTIGAGAFYNCTNLTNIDISNGLVRIEKEAFRYCTNLTKINIPKSVYFIEGAAFYLSSGYTRTVTMMREDPPYIYETQNAGVFGEKGTNNIIVPAGCGAAYKAANNWSEYADYITEASA